MHSTPLGEGAFGIVYKGELNDKVYAVKVFPLDKLTDFTAEIKSFKGLSHKNVVHMYDYSEEATFKHINGIQEKKVCYIVFDYICGGELFDFITRPPNLLESTIRAVFGQLVQGLVYVHSQGMAHRDLKLENVLLDENFGIKIADFGTAGFFSKRGNLRTCIGTPGYMAPEVSSGKKYKGVEADIFSLGCILFMLNTRMPVTEGDCTPDDSVYRHLAR